MSQEAELYDGTVLEFPDGTDPGIIQQTAKRMTMQRQSTATTPEMPVSMGAPATGLSKYNDLLGGENAQIKSAPGFLTNLSQAFTAPFNQERAPVAADQPRPGMFGRALESATGAGKGILELLSGVQSTVAPTVTKYAGENLPITPQHAEAIGNAVGAVAQGSILPWRSRAPLAPARTVEDLIAAPRPALPAPPEQLALPPPAAQPRLNPPATMQSPAMVTQVTPEGVASQAPKRTVVDLIDEVKRDVKQQVIDEIFQEIKTGRTAAMPRKATPQAPLGIEAPRAQIEPPKQVIYEGTPQGELSATSALNRPVQPRGGDLSDLQRLQLNLRQRQTATGEVPQQAAPPANEKVWYRGVKKDGGEFDSQGKWTTDPNEAAGYAGTGGRIVSANLDIKKPHNGKGNVPTVDDAVRGGVEYDGLIGEPFGNKQWAAPFRGDQVRVISEQAVGPGGKLSAKQAAPLSIEDLRGQLAPQAPKPGMTFKNIPVDIAEEFRKTGIYPPGLSSADKAKILSTRSEAGPVESIIQQPQTAAPMFEKTIAGDQAVIPGAEARTIPQGGLRSKRRQTEAPLELEQPALRAQEPELALTKEAQHVPGEAPTTTEKAAPVKSEDRFLDSLFSKADKLDENHAEHAAKGFVAVSGKDLRAAIEREKPKAESIGFGAGSRIQNWNSDYFGVTKSDVGGADLYYIHKRSPLSKVPGEPPTPTPASQLAPEEIAAQQEMRGMLGGKAKPETLQEYTNRWARETAEESAQRTGRPPNYKLSEAMTDKEAVKSHYERLAAQGKLQEVPEPRTIGDLLKGEKGQVEGARVVNLSGGRTIEVKGSGATTYYRYPDVTTGPFGNRFVLASPEFRAEIEAASPKQGSVADILKSEKGQKEPWQLRRSEYVDKTLEDARNLNHQELQSVLDSAKTRNLYQRENRRLAKEYGNLEQEQMAQHKQSVGAALAEGKAVPPEVLKDYPELKQGGVAGILKSEKGQIGSTETNPMVTGTRLAIGEAVEQSGKTVRKTMGPEGNDLIDRLTNVRNNTERNTGIMSQPLEDAIKSMKREHYENFVDVLEGKARPASPEVAQAVKIADKVRKNIAQRAEAVDLQIKNPLTGEYTPFRPREDYFPHYSKEQFAKVVENPTARADIKAQIKEKLGPNATDQQAEKALQSMIKNSKRRDSHLEIARVIDLPDYHKDPRVFLKYINDANRRIAIANEFGPKLEKSEELLSTIGQNHGDKAESFARTLFNRELRMEEVPDTMAHRMMQGARNYEVLTKLGRAFIPNMSQHSYTAIVTNATDTAKGIAKAFTKEGKTFARRAGVVNDEVLKEFYNEVTGASTGDSLIHKAIGIELKPFTWSEKLNRVTAANAGRYYANETFDALKASPDKTKLRDTLSKMGIDVDAALKKGALSSTDQLKAAQNIVNRSQFKVDPMELPLFWSSPEGKLLTQFKSFNFKSGQFMKDEILKEVAKGNVGPLIRAALLLPPAGYTVSKIQNALRSGTQDMKDGIVDYLATVGVLGIFSDLVRNGGRMDTSTIAGPTLSDVGKGLEAVSQTKQRLSDDYTGNQPAWGPLAKFAARQVPVVGSNLAAMFNEPKSERQQLLDQLGIKDDHDKQRRLLMKKLGINH